MNKFRNLPGAFFIFCCMHAGICFAQEVTPATEQQLENLTDAEQEETEDDSYLQELEFYKRHPLNLNTADEAELKELRILSDLQITHLIAYRRLFGDFVSIYELQAIPACDIATLRKLIPFTVITSTQSVEDDLKSRLKGGEHVAIFRFTQILEKSKGFNSATNTSGYLGSPARLFVRYRYSYKNLLQYGWTGDKDAGEQFLKGAQRRGFDFYSFHFFARGLGRVKALALGDFTINMGQGLIQWQSLAFKKSADIAAIKRQSAILRPYNSAGEFNFHRGIGITVRQGKIDVTAFVSLRRLSANFVPDTTGSRDNISSFQTSGYHRTLAEVADRNRLKQTVLGTAIRYASTRGNVGLNAIYFQFSNPIRKRDEPYNAFALSGKKWYNLSVDYSYTYKNFHYFGEAAVDRKLNYALLNGLLVSVDARVDISFVHRILSKGYQAINANAFTENVSPGNETGVYGGITVRPTSQWRLDAFVDTYIFPWLKSLADAPGYGRDFLLQLTYTPSRQVELSTRFRNESKQANQPDNITVMDYLVYVPKQNWRLQINYKISAAITLRNRMEMVWFDKNGTSPETGFITFFDFVYKPLMKPFAGVLRVEYFETDGYNSRVYAYENDVLYNYSIPVIFGKGYRYYITTNYAITRKISCWLRWAQTIYPGKNVIGTAQEEINGNKKTEIKLQMRYSF